MSFQELANWALQRACGDKSGDCGHDACRTAVEVSRLLRRLRRFEGIENGQPVSGYIIEDVP